MLISKHTMSMTLNKKYLFSWCDCDDECNRWLIFPVDIENVVDYENKKIDLMSLIKSSKNEIYLIGDYNDQELPKILTWVQFNKIPTSYLPKESV